MFQDLVHECTRIFPLEQDITVHSVEGVMRKVLLAFPVYRIYFSGSTISKQSLPYLRMACHEARRNLSAHYIPLLDKIEHILSQRIYQSLDKKGPESLFMCLRYCFRS